jgi:hypothetical protein
MDAYSAFFLFAAAVTLVAGLSFYYFEMPANFSIRKFFAR